MIHFSDERGISLHPYRHGIGMPMSMINGHQSSFHLATISASFTRFRLQTTIHPIGIRCRPYSISTWTIT